MPRADTYSDQQRAQRMLRVLTLEALSSPNGGGPGEQDVLKDAESHISKALQDLATRGDVAIASVFTVTKELLT
jgi:hypothetical protein